MTARSPSDDTLWTVKDVARFLRASPSWIYKLAESDQIPHFRLGSALRFEPLAIRGWLQARQRGPALTVSAHQSVDVASAKKSEG